MDVEKLMEDGTRALERAMYNAHLGPNSETVYRICTRAVLALALAAVAEEADDLATDSGMRIANNFPDAELSNFADHLRTLATQLGAANG